MLPRTILKIRCNEIEFEKKDLIVQLFFLKILSADFNLNHFDWEVLSGTFYFSLSYFH